MKNKTFFKSVYCAVKGLIFALRTEKNFKYYFGIDILFFFLDFFVFKANKSAWYAYIVTSAGVYSLECVNTSVEHLCDFVSDQIRPEIKVIKDMAAAGVLCFGIAFFAVQIIELLHYMKVLL